MTTPLSKRKQVKENIIHHCFLLLASATSLCEALPSQPPPPRSPSSLHYLEELLGSTLFCCVACGVGIVALVELNYD
ncbi:hypothetical protein S83_062185 [Arachis hypogaea]